MAKSCLDLVSELKTTYEDMGRINDVIGACLDSVNSGEYDFYAEETAARIKELEKELYQALKEKIGSRDE